MKRSSHQNDQDANGPAAAGDQGPIPKREKAHNLHPVGVGAVSSQAELSEKTLRVQNRRLTERLELSQRSADSLRRRIEQLEERKAADDTLLFALTSSWNRLDEDLRTMLQRFDKSQTLNGESSVEGSGSNQEGGNELPRIDSFSEATDSAQAFLSALSCGDREETNSRLETRVQFTRDTLSRLLTAFDRLIQRQDQLSSLISSKSTTTDHSSEISSLLNENSRLQQLCTKLQSERHTAVSQATQLGDRLAANEARLSELKVRADDLNEALDSANRNIIKLDRELGEWKSRGESGAVADNSLSTNVKVEQSSSGSPSNSADELVELRELAQERLTELQQVHVRFTETLGQLEKVKAETNELTERNIQNSSTQANTAELEAARNQLTAIKIELMEIRNAMDEARIQQALQASQKQRLIAESEAQEVSVQKELRDALDQSNTRLSNTTIDLDQLKAKYEHLRIAHDQTTTAAREMRSLIESLRTYYAQLKRELVRVRQQNQSNSNSQSADSISSPALSVSSNSTPVPASSSNVKSPQPDCLCKQQVIASKQREESLVNELTVTSQAYEEVQEQSIRLTEIVKQKDEAALRLVEERSDSMKVVRLLKEEKDALVEQLGFIQAQLDAQQHLCHRLEEKDQHLQSAFQSAEREAAIRSQALEAQRRRAADLALKLNETVTSIERYQQQSKEAQSLVGEKTVMVEKLLHQQRRAKEEVAALNRRLERLRRFEQMSAPADEVVAEELRECKELLNCPICRVRQKNAVLTQCYHLFCMNCLHTRYEVRQRKCPKCNAGFGFNEIKRVFF